MTEKQMEKILQEYINSMKSFATSKVILKAARYYVDSVNKIWTIEDVLKDPEKAPNSHISDMERAYCDGFTDACELFVRGYIKAPILGVKLINTWLFQLNALGAFSLTNLVFSSIT